jgi:hypothetical protein
VIVSRAELLWPAGGLLLRQLGAGEPMGLGVLPSGPVIMDGRNAERALTIAGGLVPAVLVAVGPTG